LPTHNILLVDDEARLMQTMAQALSGAGFSTFVAPTAEEAFFVLHKERIDAVVLDLSLPRRSGLELLAQLRSEGSRVPVIMLTSHNETEDRVRGLEAGADDYLGKPFSLVELIARIRALLRRSAPLDATSTEPGGGTPPESSTKRVILGIGDLHLDASARIATRASMRLDLTAREFDLLLYLAEQPGLVVSREMLARHVWHETARFTPINNVIDVQIARLRRKLDEPFSTRLLHTVRGVGFTLRDGVDAGAEEENA
jgi:DNA-binding response OmpR family regulator